MTPEEAKALVTNSVDGSHPVFLPPSVLKELTVDDLPENSSIQVGKLKDGVHHIEWEGSIYAKNAKIFGCTEYIWTRKFWYAPIGLEHYLDLVRRSVETRAKTHHDVSLEQFEDDGALIFISYEIETNEVNVQKAYQQIRKVCDELEESSQRACDEAGARIAEIAARISGWGNQELDKLLNSIDQTKNIDEKGRSLEELMCRLFEQVDGFSVAGRVRTATEEIDVTIINDSNDPRFRREAALLVAECKNWSSKCGKNEFVIFKEKIDNRSQRCTLGFLISWNGFKTTVTKELLRGSRENVLIVPITGKDIREAVAENNFTDVLARCWEDAINT